MKRNPHAGARQSGGLRLEVFTGDELREIHLATLEVLCAHRRLRRGRGGVGDLRDAGAAGRSRHEHGRIPAHLVEDAIRAAPARSSSAAATRRTTSSSKTAASVSPTSARASRSSTPTPASCAKREAGRRRLPRIIDALPEIDVVERPLGAHDAPPETAALHNAEAIFANTTKHATIGPLTGFCARKMIDMAAAVAGGRGGASQRPILSFVTCPVSPLKLVADGLRAIIIDGARAGVPVNVLSMAMAGGSVAGQPGRHARDPQRRGTSGITLAQLTARRAGDLRLLDDGHGPALRPASVGSPECALINAGVACLARYYLLPSWVAGA